MLSLHYLELMVKTFFHLGDKKVVAAHVKQVVVLYSNDCMGIHSGGLSIGHLRQVVLLHRSSPEQVWLQCFKLIYNNFICLIEKWVQIFKWFSVSHRSMKSLFPPLHKFTIRNLDLFFSFFWEKNPVYLLTCQNLERMEKNCPVGK